MITVNILKKIHTQNGDTELQINFELKQNTCTAIYGESGSGKTTILRLIAGLSKPDSGIIQSSDEIFFDSELNINIEVQKRNIGFVFQDYALFPNMTVEENILFALANKFEKKEKASYIDQLMTIMEINNLVKKYPHQISGGQKQRVALARALARKPKILLLDEPLSALDYAMRAKLQEYLIKLMNLYSFTTVLVSHDLQEVKAMANQLIHLKNGAITSTRDSSEFNF